MRRWLLPPRSALALGGLLFTVAPAAAAVPEAELAREIARYENEEIFVQKARGAVSRLVQQGKAARAQAVARYAEKKLGPPPTTTLLDEDDVIILGTLARDYTFLDGLTHSVEPHGEWRHDDELTKVLVGQIPEARRRAQRDPRLRDEDRAVLDLLLTYVQHEQREAEPGVTPRALSTRAQAFLRQYPATRYRPYVSALMIERFQPLGNSWYLTVGGSWLWLDGATASQVSAQPGLSVALGLEVRRWQTAFTVAFHGGEVRQAFTRDGVAWPVGAGARWTSGGLTVGYQLAGGRHRLVPAAGFGWQNLKHQSPGDAKESYAEFTAALVGVEYSLAFVRSQPLLWDSWDDGLLLVVRVGMEKALHSRTLAREAAPLMLLLQVGLGYEGRKLGFFPGGG